MLKELSKKDNYWRKIALKITKCKYEADDLVNEMYIRAYDISIKYPGKEIKTGYIYRIMSNIYKDNCKQKNKSNDYFDFERLKQDESYQINDKEKQILERFNKLDWKEKELIELSYHYSYREIAKICPLINYMSAYLTTKGAINKVLKDDIQLHKNKKLKYKKNG